MLSRAERAYSGGWDLELLASRFDITKQVIFDRSLRIGEGVPVTELARRMGACDIHLLPFDRAGWELTVLETGACGVANVITDVAAPPEYARPFSELVPPAVGLFGPHGTRGIMDIGGAIEALLRLTVDPAHRRRLGQCGVDVARAHSWERVVQAWDGLLGGVSPSQAAL
jgi:glycosyltransferase involved in cell wall biosynthesis